MNDQAFDFVGSMVRYRIAGDDEGEVSLFSAAIRASTGETS